MIPWHSDNFDQHEQVTAFTDSRTGLRAIVAVHSTTLGPAVGGTRFFPYADDAAALDDVLRLSRAMSFKCALAGVPSGGGKAVIIGDPHRLKTRELLLAFAGKLNVTGQTFATGEDVGVSLADCEVMAEVTPYVAGTRTRGGGDPSQHTADGVVEGLLAVAGARFGRDRLQGLRVAVQGLGSVGWALCQRLAQQGVELIVADLDAARVHACVDAFAATAELPDRIHAAEADIFSPCAMGGVITEIRAQEIKAAAVAGAANNPLSSAEAGRTLHRRGVLFAPDFVINAGGVIGAIDEFCHMPGRPPAPAGAVAERLKTIRSRLFEIFRLSEASGEPPTVVAEQMAREIIRQGRTQGATA
jgi:leucine dehydrogenase